MGKMGKNRLAEGINKRAQAGTESDVNATKNTTFTVTAIDAPAAGTSLSTAYIDVNYTTAGNLPASARIICSGTV